MLDAAANHDGHTLPLLLVQLTELVHWVFVGRVLVQPCRRRRDGTSFWHFFHAWSEISKNKHKRRIQTLVSLGCRHLKSGPAR
ncbi:hypothetical protein QJS04_geneDACA001580 [Acorus gramineus]|uniref:Secreted protein n=1 Tax=Acorus gramineus TaxID=55184 RepID=A0AAV9BJS5_ACOGR|nr:hypothetical protein QJS04_geneDACA001580 [Acorus gramineus]